MNKKFIGTIGYIKGNLMASPALQERGYTNENFFPGAENIPDSEPTILMEIPTIPVMTSNTAPEGVCSQYTATTVSTGNYKVQPGWKAFNPDTQWSSGSFDETPGSASNWMNNMPMWVQYEYASPVNKGLFKYTHIQQSYFPPKDIDVVAINENNEEIIVHQIRGLAPAGDYDKEGNVGKPYESEEFRINFKFKAIKIVVQAFTIYSNHYRSCTLKNCQLVRLK